MPNCKPGDLAIVVRGDNTGHLVFVEREHLNDERISCLLWFRHPSSVAWVVRSAHIGGDLMAHRGIERRALKQVVCRDSYLRPIRPDQTLLDELRSEPITA